MSGALLLQTKKGAFGRNVGGRQLCASQRAAVPHRASANAAGSAVDAQHMAVKKDDRHILPTTSHSSTRSDRPDSPASGGGWTQSPEPSPAPVRQPVRHRLRLTSGGSSHHRCARTPAARSHTASASWRQQGGGCSHRWNERECGFCGRSWRKPAVRELQQ